MNINIVAKVTAEGKLEIPPEVLVKLQPLTEYEVIVTEDEIVFKKNSQQLTWTELSERIETLGVDADEPTLQQISEMTLVLLIYQVVFRNLQMGYAAAIAFLLAIVIITITLIQGQVASLQFKIQNY